MRTMRFLLIPLAVGLVLAACGSDDSKSSTTATTVQAEATTTSSAAAGAVTVKISKTNLGDVLADGQGRTLYSMSTESATDIKCVGQCANRWPPLVVAAGQNPTAEAGVGTLVVVNRP